MYGMNRSQMPDTSFEEENIMATAALVLGIIGLIAWLIPLFGYPVTIVGIVMGVKGRKSEKKGMATAGLVMSIIGLILSLGNSILGILLANGTITLG
jgi:hypothetical protein